VNSLKVSVIVLTRNRHEMLQRCLNSIASSYPAYHYDELIVVDNGSEEAEAKLNRELADRLGAIYCWESKVGVSFARNAGVRKARGDILVFSDDDFIVEMYWLRNLLPSLEDKQVMCCTGRILPYRQQGAAMVFNRMLGYDKGARRRIFTSKDIRLLRLLRTMTLVGHLRLGGEAPVPWAFGTSFCSLRKCAFDKVGFFDEESRANGLLVPEDQDMFYRVLKKQYKIAYEPSAVVKHDDPRTMQGVLQKSYEYGLHKAALFAKHRKDPYMLGLCIGTLLFLTFVWLRTVVKLERNERKVVAANAKGYLDGFRRSRLRNVSRKEGDTLGLPG